MPQKGERKTINGVTGEWDGQTWRQVDVNAELRAANARPLSEPTTFSEGFHQSEALKQNAVAGGAVGFAEGLVPGAVNTVVQAIPSLVSAALGTGVGTWHLVTDPVNTIKDAIEAVRGIPSKGYDMLVQAKELAEKDPVAFGKAVGEVTGGVEAGIVASKAVPLAPKPVARKVGSVMETVGKKGAWPIRMVGAHQLGSGNPLGVATMMAPEALQSTGGKLREWGGGEHPNPIMQKDSLTGKKLPQMPSSTRSVDLKPTGAVVRIAPQADAAVTAERVPYGGAEPAPYRTAAKKAVAADQAAAEAAQLETENARRLAEIEARKQGMEAAPPIVREQLSATDPSGKKVSATQVFRPAEEEGGGGSAADILENSQNPDIIRMRQRRDAGMNDAPLDVTRALRAASREGEPAAAVADVPAGAPPADAANAAARAEAAGQLPAFLDPEAQASGRALDRRVNQGASPTGAERRVRGVPNPIEQQLRQQLQGEAPVTPEGPQPMDPRITGLPPGEEIPPAAAVPPVPTDEPPKTPPAGAAEKIPVSEIPPTRSSRTGGDLMSATPGLTVNDVKAIGLNPDIPIKTVTPELRDRILKARQARSVDYKADAQMNAMERSMLDREPGGREPGFDPFPGEPNTVKGGGPGGPDEPTHPIEKALMGRENKPAAKTPELIDFGWDKEDAVARKILDYKDATYEDKRSAAIGLEMRRMLREKGYQGPEGLTYDDYADVMNDIAGRDLSKSYPQIGSRPSADVIEEEAEEGPAPAKKTKALPAKASDDPTEGFSPALREELNYRLDLMEESAAEEGEPFERNKASMYQAMRDIEDADSKDSPWMKQFGKELQDWQIKEGVYKAFSKEDLEHIQVSHGKKYEFKRGDKYYRFQKHVPGFSTGESE